MNEEYQRIAREDSKSLVEMIRNESLEPHILPLAVDALSVAAGTREVTETLVRCLEHESALVRESAAYACYPHLGAGLMGHLENRLKAERNYDVRAAIEDVLYSER